MNSAVCQAITTELTLSGINGTSATLPWDNFYNMVLSTVKLLDNSNPKPKEQPRQANQVLQQQQGGRGKGRKNQGGRGGGATNQGSQNNQGGQSNLLSSIQNMLVLKCK
jgi:hypothetical protein